MNKSARYLSWAFFWLSVIGGFVGGVREATYGMVCACFWYLVSMGD